DQTANPLAEDRLADTPEEALQPHDADSPERGRKGAWCARRTCRPCHGGWPPHGLPFLTPAATVPRDSAGADLLFRTRGKGPGFPSDGTGTPARPRKRPPVQVPARRSPMSRIATARHLQRDLDTLQRDLLALADLVEEAIFKAIRALQERDVTLAREV